MHLQHSKQGEENQPLNSPVQAKTVQQKTSHPSPYKTREGKLGPIQSNTGQKPPIQAKQRPVNKSTPAPRTIDPLKVVSNPELETHEHKMADTYGMDAPVQQKPNNTGLPDHLKAGIENLSGYSMDDVKVHYNSDKPAHLQAHAYAQGTNIHIASGQEKHLPHEAWHVVQQKQGRVQPTMQMKGGVNVNDDGGLEKEADVMGAKALQRKEDKSNEKQGLGSKVIVQQKTQNMISHTTQQQFPIQRKILAMGPDQINAVQAWGDKTDGLFSSKEATGIFGTGSIYGDTDRTLTLWGHAGQEAFGGSKYYNPGELVQILKDLGLVDSNYTTLELIGCEPNKTSDKQTLTYAQEVQRALDEDMGIGRKIKVKTFTHPSIGDYSTNYRFEEVGKFVYIIFKNQEFEEDMKQKFILLGRIYTPKKAYTKFLEFLTQNGAIYQTDDFHKIRKYLMEPPKPKKVEFKGKHEEDFELLIPSEQGNM